jgi:hypothetical protein
MRYLRMFTNALTAGVLGAVYLVVLVLILNPHVPLISMTTVRWFGALVSFYGLHLTVAVYIAILFREVIASRPLHPGWLSVRLLAWLGALFAATSAAITWANLQGFRAVLGESASGLMQTAAVAETVAAVVLVGVAVLRYSFGRKGSRATGVLMTVALVASVAVPLWVRGPGELPVPTVPRVMAPTGAMAGSSSGIAAVAPRVRMLLVDGASLGVIKERAAAGRLSNLGLILDRGAVMSLATLKPTQAEPVWTAAATGKYAAKNGVRSNAVFRVTPDDTEAIDLLPDYCFAYALVYQQYLVSQQRTREHLRARPFWDIAADYGVASGVVRWPLTSPAALSRGYLISDQFHLGTSSPLRLAGVRAGVPTTAADIAREVFDATTIQEAPLAGVAAPADEVDDDARGSLDRVYRDVAVQLEPQFAVHVTALHLSGVDAVSHAYWDAADPTRPAGRRTGDVAVFDEAYDELDTEVGRQLARLRPGDLLLVVSGFGMEPVSVVKRGLARLLGQPALTGSHEGAPDGFLLAYGRDVDRAELPRGAIVDLAPTVLYYLGLPVGRDMDGYARTDLFVPAYRRDHPVTFISTHEK